MISLQFFNDFFGLIKNHKNRDVEEMATKEQFIKQKLRNFSIYIAEKLGNENLVYKEISAYEHRPVGDFLEMIIKLAQFAQKGEDGELIFPDKAIAQYLESRGLSDFLKKNDAAAVVSKINQYFSMFLNIVNS